MSGLPRGPERTRLRPTRVAGWVGAGLLLLLLGVGWRLAESGRRPSASPMQALPVTASGPREIQVAQPRALADTAASASAGAPATRAAVAEVWRLAPEVVGPRRQTALDLCGAGPVALDYPAAWRATAGGGPGEAAQEMLEAVDEAVQMRLDAAWPRLVQHLRAQPGPRAQAAGWLLALPQPTLPTEPADPLAAGRVTAPEADAQREAAMQGLVQLARGAGDAWVLQQAVSRCIDASVPAACAGLTARHWLQLDRGNAQAWLALWAQEPAAADEALHGLALSRSADSGLGQLPWLVVQHWPGDLPTYLQAPAALRAIGIEMAGSGSHWMPLLATCLAAVKQGDANRRAVCDATAQLLASAGRDLGTRSTGLALGTRLGWEPQRRQGLARTLDSAREGAMADLPITPDYTCAAVAHTRQQLRGRAEQGEFEHGLARWREGR